MSPDFELLKDAYAIIDGIPDQAFDLGEVLHMRISKDMSCGTIACAAGWLSLHPTFAAHLKPRAYQYGPSSTNWRVRWDGIEFYEDNVFAAMQTLFGIDLNTAYRIFGLRDEGEGGPHLTDKELWKLRVRTFLKKHEQPGEPA